MTTLKQAAQPLIDGLLAAAHRNFHLLRERRNALERGGIGRDHLAGDMALMAFSLLGDHGREAVVGDLLTNWDDLRSKGLAHGSIDSVPTPVLRLLVHALPHAHAIASVWEHLRSATDAPAPPDGVWASATCVRGLWGQKARLHFTVRDVDYLMIDPDPVFGLQPALLALDPDTVQTGSFPFPVDNGEIRMRLRHKNGQICGQVVHAIVEEPVW